MIALVFACSACENPETDQKSDPLPPSAPDLRESSGSSGATDIAPDEPASLTVSIRGADFDRKYSAATLSATDDSVALVAGDFKGAPSSGYTSGAVFSLGEDFEKVVSGKTVTIKVFARGGPLAMSYSTADVGNSGWQQVGVSEDWAEFTMVYEVPKLKNGRGDFVGIIPTDADQGVEIKSVEVSVSGGG